MRLLLDEGATLDHLFETAVYTSSGFVMSDAHLVVATLLDVGVDKADMSKYRAVIQNLSCRRFNDRDGCYMRQRDIVALLNDH